MVQNDLALLILDNCMEFGKKVEKNLLKIRNESSKTYIARLTSSRFSNGEGKVTIHDSIRSKDVYIFCDIGNYSTTYKFFGKDHAMTPDEHFQDIKRVISATCGHSSKITVVTPLLYQARQHRRKGRESLDGALGLQELERLGVHNIITFDAHDPNIINATPGLSFDNFYPTNEIIKEMSKNDPKIFENALVVSPDFGAMERARYYADILGCDVGVFYKRRDLSKVVNGKNPIVSHNYMGSDVKDKNVLIVDDMVASGGSVIEVSEKLRQMGAKSIAITATFALFTEGFEKFEKAKKENLFDTFYTTNLSYIPKEITQKDWFYAVDMSYFLAQVIDSMNKRESLGAYFDKTRQTFNIIKKSVNKKQ